jgi:hypothetical protein
MSEGDTDSSNDFSGREVDEDSGSDKENDDYESTVEPELDVSASMADTVWTGSH